MRRVLAAVAVMLVASGCTGSGDGDSSATPTEGDISLIEVGTSDTAAPSVSWPEDLEFGKTQTEVLWDGEGEPLVDGQSLLLDVYIQSLETGEVLENTYDGLPAPNLLAPEMLGDELYAALLELNVGARILSVAPSEGEFAEEPAIVIVIDVLSDKAVGEAVDPVDDLPVVTSATNGAPLVSIDPDAPLPTELTVATLIQGNGVQVEEGSFVIMQFLAVYGEAGSGEEGAWVAGDERQSTWSAEYAPWEGQIGTGGVIRGLDEGLIDHSVGSRVLIVVPEAWGYPGEGTLIYVVDILDVWNEDDI